MHLLEKFCVMKFLLLIQLYGVSYRKKDGNTGLRMFTVSDDHSVAFFQQSGMYLLNSQPWPNVM